MLSVLWQMWLWPDGRTDADGRTDSRARTRPPRSGTCPAKRQATNDWRIGPAKPTERQECQQTESVGLSEPNEMSRSNVCTTTTLAFISYSRAARLSVCVMTVTSRRGIWNNFWFRQQQQRNKKKISRIPAARDSADAAAAAVAGRARTTTCTTDTDSLQ